MSAQDPWSSLDDYITRTLVGADPVLEAAREDSLRAGLPDISVSAPQGKMLHLMARMIGARRVLEIGTLGGYSTIWLARALPAGGRLVTLEVSPRHAEVARANLDRAGLGSMVDIRVGAALESLPALASEGAEPFDLVFVDADKANIPAYFDWAVKLARPGTAIVVDNVVRAGALIDPGDDEAAKGVRALHEQLASRSDVSATTIQTVGAKGHDGFTLAVVNP